MSKKQLLNESEIRRFMKLANLEPLAKNVVREGWNQEEVEESLQAEAAPAGDDMPAPQAGDTMAGDAMAADAGEEAEVEVGGEDSLTPEEIKKGEEVLSLMFGKKVSLETEEGGEESAGKEDMDMDMSDEEDEDKEGEDKEGEDKEGEDKEGEDDVDEMDETLSEDALVETVLARVTARLVAEAAKKKKMPKGLKDAMKAKAEKTKKAEKPAAKESLELKGDKLEEATSAEGGGPLLKQGKNKYDVYKGHADMTMAKGDKGGKGGHSLETVSAKAEHTVTHGGKNLATLGGNKKKV